MGYIFFPDPTPVFPDLPPLTWSVHKKPIMSSTVITATTGRECQLARAVYPRWAFLLSYGGGNSWLRDETENIVSDPELPNLLEFHEISALWLACLGSYGEFYYNDPSDNSRALWQAGIGDQNTTTYPLYFTWGTGPFSPPLLLPVQGIASLDAVYLDNVLQDPSTYGVDATNTKLVFNSVVGLNTVILVSFHFYYRCRFLDDQIDFSQWAKNLWELKEIKFESVKP